MTWTYALGTLAFSYSLLFMSHQTTAMLLFVGFYLCWRVLRGERPEWWLAIAGLLLGLAVVAEYTSALPAVAIGAYAILGWKGRAPERLRRALVGAAGALPAIVFLGWYHRACFGGVLETGYRHLADIAYQPWHQGGFLGIKTPTWAAFSGSFFSPLRGLFALSPLLLLGMSGMRLLWSAGREACRAPGARDLHDAAFPGIRLFHIELQLRLVGMDIRPPSPDRMGAIPSPARRPRTRGRPDSRFPEARRPGSP